MRTPPKKVSTSAGNNILALFAYSYICTSRLVKFLFQVYILSPKLKYIKYVTLSSIKAYDNSAKKSGVNLLNNHILVALCCLLYKPSCQVSLPSLYSETET